MAGRVALSLVIGGAVASSVGAAFRTVENGIQKLEAKGNKAKVLKSTIGETIKLREEWKRAHDSGSANADKLQKKLDGNLDALRRQGIEVGRLGREYQRLGREARAADLQLKGHQQLQAGKTALTSNIGRSVVATGLAAVPTTISANYQAIIRDIAIKADIANKPEEQQLSRTVLDTAKDTGMSRNDVADLVNQLVGAGMDLDKAMSYAPVAAKFAVGQGASGVDTASMVQALEQNAKISDPKVMQQALEAIAYQGQAGSFEANAMAKWFPQLLAGMEKNGITGLDAVTSLGSMLQVQMKTAGSSDEAANNFKNWMEKIGAGDVVKAYKDAGIDYQASLNTGLQKGMNVIESSMALAMKYVQATDPAKAKKIEEAKANIDKEADPEKAKAALEALERTLRTGDIFADQQVKAALTAYGQNRGLYEELKADSRKASGILDKNLAERRETSKQQWSELGQAVDDSMRSIGDAIRPATDLAAKGLTLVARKVTALADDFQPLVMGIAGATAAVMAFVTARSALKIGRGVLNIALGRSMEGMASRGNRTARPPINLPKTGSKVLDTGLGLLGKVFAPGASGEAAEAANDPQRVFVVNADAIGGIGSRVANNGPAGGPKGSRRSRRRERRRAARQGGAGGSAAKAKPSTKVPVPKPQIPALPPAVPSALTGMSKLGKAARALRGVTRLGKFVPGGKLIDGGATVLDVAMNAQTQDEKAEGYGGAAGGMAGTLAGAAAGAAIGSVVPVIGTAVGGVVGAFLGGLGGESVGGWLGKRLFGEDAEEAEAEDAKAEDAEAKPSSTPAATLPVTPPADREIKPQPTPPARAVSYDPRDPESENAFLVPALAAGRVRFPGADLVPPGYREKYEAEQAQAAQAKAEAASGVQYGPGGEDPFMVPALTAGRVRFPGADLVPPGYREKYEAEQAQAAQAKAKATTGVQYDPAPKLGETVKAKPAPAAPAQAKVPLVVPVPAASAVRFPGADPVRPQPPAGLGDLVRDMSKSVAPPAKLPDAAPAKAATPTPAPKVDQAFSFSPSIKLDVQGDVKDPAQLLREAEGTLRQMFDAWSREAASRMASTQLFDQPHV
ncbi:TP901 family phage tail tape measure protein [Pseudomonas sp. URMO17WK12:I10]|uniref:phage tail tape measure protein n=1 Tax=unclassified Pseudomonas TaxID=196821 RepID=UPI0004888F36|nr:MULTISPECIES: phage tail tape measure protein [unclassified Pseudomonas]RDL18512.1 TP901 family phage tail tape measure protein [Pseudomonas sp. LAMO17WK12:I3]RED04070.1 TP901 family phage tail tape measure protein [Pseudomonas sp. URMO17WK12:I10]SOD10272.1 phage tail tape measure protein, TP901 family, core region [Pseudomonas sp. URMO17WK12:I9]